MQDKNYPVITIDGPSGSGKGTISKLLAKKLGWHFLDSGILYRVLAYVYLEENLSKENIIEDALEKLAINLQIDRIKRLAKEQNNLIRTENIGNLASKLAEIPKVRAALLAKQREFLKSPGLVADGRDMGTVVFPNAVLKFFLEADPKIRANRRYLQLKDMGVDAKLHNLVGEVFERDLRDRQRAIANLKPATDAILIDTTAMTINEVFAMVMEKVILIV